MTTKFEIKNLFKVPTSDLFRTNVFSDFLIFLLNKKVLYCHKVILNFYSNKFFEKEFMDEIILKIDSDIIEKFIKLLYDAVYESNLKMEIEFRDGNFFFDFELINELIKISNLAKLFGIKTVSDSIIKYCDTITVIKEMNTNYRIDKEYINPFFGFDFDYDTKYSYYKEHKNQNDPKHSYSPDYIQIADKEYYDFKSLFSDKHFGYVEILSILEKELNIELFVKNEKKSYSTLILNDDVCKKVVHLFNESKIYEYISCINYYLAAPHLYDLIEFYEVNTSTILFDYFLTQIKVLTSTVKNHQSILNTSFRIDHTILRKMIDHLVNFSKYFDYNCHRDKMLLYYLKIFTCGENIFIQDNINSFEQNEKILLVDGIISRIFEHISYRNKNNDPWQYKYPFWNALSGDKQFRDLIEYSLKIKGSVLSVDKFITTVSNLATKYHPTHFGNYQNKISDKLDFIMVCTFVKDIKLFDSLCEYIVNNYKKINTVNDLIVFINIEDCKIPKWCSLRYYWNKPPQLIGQNLDSREEQNVINFIKTLAEYKILDYNIFNGDWFLFSPEAKKILEEFVKPCYTKPAVHKYINASI